MADLGHSAIDIIRALVADKAELLGVVTAPPPRVVVSISESGGLFRDDGFKLIQRWYDPQFERWEDPRTITGQELLENYGETPDDWKKAAESWIEMGGKYRFEIVRGFKMVIWTKEFEGAPPCTQ